MKTNIKTTIIELPNDRAITIVCPGCKALLERFVKIDQREGEEKCGLCHTKFKWEEEIK